MLKYSIMNTYAFQYPTISTAWFFSYMYTKRCPQWRWPLMFKHKTLNAALLDIYCVNTLDLSDHTELTLVVHEHDLSSNNTDPPLLDATSFSSL
jgi:hypothetical protein